ncbi:NnrU family protein [Acuticoccus sp. M5D2P5]|uniref:NnrU family protein n=1 Tax=Acuticoccus kalidii TaxID=2910977 RepID=UPI001F30115D|nr:NnrU family protein [Acuticoccus kalidii]MCF3935728.1 NnrU family protein [Acuticoccus kalidii]
MLLMVLGLVLFLGVHSLQIAWPLRARLLARFGAGPYRALYSLVAVIGLVLTAVGYAVWRFEGAPLIYRPPIWGQHLALLLMWFAFVALAAAYAPGHIRKRLKHPMLVAVKIWAVAHLLANGDAATVTLCLAFLAWAVVDRIAVKRRERAGRASVATFKPRWRADAIAVSIGTIVYVLFVWKLHLWLIGVSPIAMGTAM